MKDEDRFWGAVGSFAIVVAIVGLCVLLWRWLLG